MEKLTYWVMWSEKRLIYCVLCNEEKVAILGCTARKKAAIKKNVIHGKMFATTTNLYDRRFFSQKVHMWMDWT